MTFFQQLRLHFINNNLDFADNGRKSCSYVEELFECLSIIYQSLGNFYVTDVTDLCGYRSVNRLPEQKMRTVRRLPYRHTDGTQATKKEQCPGATRQCVSILFEYTFCSDIPCSLLRPPSFMTQTARHVLALPLY
jgi:hypothetical protein